MIRLEISFIALSGSKDLQIETDINIILEFLSIFKGNIDYATHKIDIEMLQKNTQDIREKVNQFVKKISHVNPALNKLNSYFNSMENDEYFLITPLSKIDRHDLYLFLSSLKEGESYEKLIMEDEDLFGEFRKQYTIYGYNGAKRYLIGEKDRKKRICRYCKKSMPEVTFKKVAHAISEALGNKQIISCEECDDCNQKFGTGIEEDLILYLQVFRSFFEIQGKKGVGVHLKGKNFDIKKDDSNGMLKIKYVLDKENPSEEDLEAPMNLKTFENVNFQNIYRTLCKYAIGIMDSSQIEHFNKTISWINRENSLTELPKVAVLTSYAFFDKHPHIMLYLRKSDDKNLPHCICEFHFVHLTFVVIIPLSDMDERNFVNKNEYDTFWKVFKHYQTEEWIFYDFSNDTKQDFRIKINLNVTNNSK